MHFIFFLFSSHFLFYTVAFISLSLSVFPASSISPPRLAIFESVLFLLPRPHIIHTVSFPVIFFPVSSSDFPVFLFFYSLRACIASYLFIPNLVYPCHCTSGFSLAASHLFQHLLFPGFIHLYYLCSGIPSSHIHELSYFMVL